MRPAAPVSASPCSYSSRSWGRPEMRGLEFVGESARIRVVGPEMWSPTPPRNLRPPLTRPADPNREPTDQGQYDVYQYVDHACMILLSAPPGARPLTGLSRLKLWCF